MARLTRDDALRVFRETHIDYRKDFHALHSSDVMALLAFADSYGYRAPKNANGSRGRYWHAYLVRALGTLL